MNGNFTKIIIYLILIFLLYRVGLNIPLNFLNNYSDHGKDLGFLFSSIVNTNAMSNSSLFSLGILPYISATILYQIYKHSFKVKSQSNKKIIFYIMTFISVMQSFFYVKYSDHNISVLHHFSNHLLLVTGFFSVFWISQLISFTKLLNGVSILIVINIIDYFLFSIVNILNETSTGILTYDTVLLSIFFVTILLILVILFESSKRNFTLYQSNAPQLQSKNVLPLKVNNAGVMPVIFLSSINVLFYYIMASFSSFSFYITFVKYILDVILLFYFVHIYSSIIFDVQDVSDQFKKRSIVIDKMRPGQVTKEYLKKSLFNLNNIASIYLSFVFLFNYILEYVSLKPILSGTSMIILVAVLFDILKKSQYSMNMKKYNDMLYKKGAI